MPQMSPMNWTILMIIFIMILITIMTLNYFLFQPLLSNPTLNSLNKKSINWKW